MKPVLVVGAGIGGLALARALGPARVRLVDAAPRPAAESTAHGVGMIRRLADDPLERTLALRTAAWLREWAAPAIARPHGAWLGHVSDPTAANDAVAHLRAAGVEVVAARAGDVAPILARSPLRPGWWIPDELTVDPPAIAQHLAADPLDFQGETTVHALRVHAGRITGVDTSRGLLEAEVVVLAAGAWCAGLTRPLGLARPLVPLRRTVFEVAAEPAERHPWVWLEDAGLYLRPIPAGFYVSPCDERPEPDPPFGSLGGPAPGTESLLRHKLRQHVPALADAPIRRAWSGLRTFAPDRRPVLGADPDVSGLWWLAGLGGSGLTTAGAAASAVATWLDGGTTPWLPPALVSPGRPFLARFPIRPSGAHQDAVLISAHHPSSG